MIAEPARGPVQAPVHIELTGVSKRFGSTQAVDGVNLAVRRGSIHALVGENGAGKSTVGKIVSGLHGPDSGSLTVNDRPVRFRSPRHALDAGITAIAQELALVPDRTVVDNVFLGVEATRCGWVRRPESRRRFRALAERTGIRVDPAARVGDLSVAGQQCVEILRAVARRTELVVMDEPSARLSIAERDQLHRLVRSLRDQGITVLFISHFLDEVLALADEVTIMRDGRVVRSTTPSSETADSLVEAMIGRELDATFPPKPALPDVAGVPALRVRGLRCTGSVREGSSAGLDLDVAAGEIVGIAGLVGSGRTEFLRAIYGADPVDGGEVVVGTQSLRGSRPDRAIRAGVGLIPESRKDHGLLIERSVRENVSLPHLERMTRAGVVNRIAERRFVRAASTDAGVRDGGMETPMRLLSGGNQQKCLFARLLVPGLRVLIADEPTRGVDVGSKRAIYDLIASAAAVSVPSTSGARHQLSGLARFGIVWVTLALFVVLAITTDGFLTAPNLRDVLDQQATLLIAASVATLTMIAGGFDVSIAAVAVVAPLVALRVENATGSVVVALIAGCAFGLAVGLANGSIVAFARINSFITTLAMSFIVFGLGYIVSERSILRPVSENFRDIARTRVLSLTTATWISLAVVAVAWIALAGTRFGRIVVPITSDTFNEQIALEARSFVGPEIDIEVSNLRYGPASIESFYDEVLAGPAIVEEVRRAADAGADSVFITCFGDPAVPAARELVDIPVVGGFEPAIATALTLGARFSVITVLENVVPMISDLATRMGIRERMVSVEAVDTPVLELHDGDALLKSLSQASHRALDQGADVLVLGCTGMLGVAAALQSQIAAERVRVPVVDPTGASLGLLLTLHSMGLKPSRRTYMPPPDKERISA